MANPKKKLSKARTRSRRAGNSKVDVKSVAYCSRCNAPKLPHRVCPHCGYYKNTQVLDIKEYE
jgi:large subunit ribosomal protein L32